MDNRAITGQQLAEDMEESVWERAAVLQFGSGREMSREEAERIDVDKGQLNEYAEKVREVLGVEFVRREFLPVLRA